MEQERGTLDGDFVGERKENGLYRVGRWNADSRTLIPVPGCEDECDEAELLRRFDALRPTGDTWIQEVNGLLLLVQP